MKLAILILLLLAIAFFELGRWTDRHSGDVASVSSSIVPYAIGSTILVGDLILLLGYALWRLFT